MCLMVNANDSALKDLHVYDRASRLREVHKKSE